MPQRVSPTDRIRGHIYELFASDRQLPEILEDVARLGAQLLMQAALEAEITEFLGRDRYEPGRGLRGCPARLAERVPGGDRQNDRRSGATIAAQDAMLLDRVTYETFAAHWPHQTGEMADTMNSTAKYVVSGTLESANWQNSTLIPAASAFAEIAELKQQQGQNIGMTGSATLVSSLLREGLLDELHLFVFPVVLGSGKRLFGEPGDKLALKLIDSATFETGVVHLTYAKA